MAKRPILLITGAGRGIGAVTAQLAAARGFDVAINYKSDADTAAKVADAVQSAGAKAIAVQADMAHEADIARMFKTVDDKLGRLTHFVYNCGITGQASRVDAADPAMMREVVEINVVGALIALKHAITRISTRHGGPGGAMVLISSRASTLGAPNEYVWYAATKGAIDAMTVGLSLELAKESVRVNSVSPGMIATTIHAAGGQPDRLQRLGPLTPMGRPGEPGEVAEAILFLLSDAASYINGTILRVSGGR